ncbi:unnamed protein product [Fraxinus pennsylvanica]|uniref:ATP-dependent RNA helicase n=1 Tax=Fraxinus pennsylvanica TaxID=56036 RepID=A0AAD1ZN01_9LAMI|nr:unnamed protein product [Fraxinus pennsylvanica]
MESVKKNEDTQQRTEEKENDQEMAQLGHDENQEKKEDKKDILGLLASLDDSNIENEPENVSKDEGEDKRGLESDGTVSFEPFPISEPTMNATKEMGLQNKTQQGYCVVPSAKRFIVLYSFLKRNLSKKVMVFFSSCNSVKYHSALLRHSEIYCFDIHEKQKQQERTYTFFNFCKSENGILLCNDGAPHGLDIPSVDWIIQYEPPYDHKEFVNRVYRTAYRDVLLFLIPEELQFRRELKAAKVLMNEYIINENKLENVQPDLEKLVANNDYLRKLAKDAYKSYIAEYKSHSSKGIFNVHKLDLKAVAASFCFCGP